MMHKMVSRMEISFVRLLEIILGMLAAGAEGETLKQLLEFIGHESIDQFFSESPTQILSGVDVSLANGVWVDKRLEPIRSCYQWVLKTIYKTKAKYVDFANKVKLDEAVKETNDGLKNLLQLFHSDDALFHGDFDLENEWLDKIYEETVSGIVDMRGLYDSMLYVSKILQKSFIEVDEIGTEATAFTMLLQTGGGAPPPQPPPSFVAYHPFLFMIREDVSKAVLFVGAVLNPQLNYLEQPLPPALVAPAGQHVTPEILAAHTAWVKGSKEIAGLMLMTMEPEIQRNLENLHANDMLKELKALFAQQAEQELLQTTRDFHACKQEEGQPVSSYVLKMKGYIDNLECLGHPVTLGLAMSLILIGLRKEFDGFVQNYNMHSLGKTVNELHAMLKLHEQTLNLPKNNAPALHAIRAGKVQKGKKHNKPQPSKAGRGQNQGNGKHKHAYAPKPKIPPPPKREDPAKDSICHECGETGHWKRNCPQYLAELLKKKKNAASRAGGGSGIFVIELNTFLNRSWIYDTGCGTHICNTTQGLRASRKLKPGALSLYVGNGQREAVEAIGNFDLSLPSGLVIVLNNCHYAPSITRGVISVSRLYEDGFINRFVNNTIQVSRNNMVYFSAIPRDGIFEIDLSNSYANESSIYTVSNKRAKLDLDSALLWHCRLGHISKKRIEKLQHDGLLNSTDLRAFEKCVPCMSGKTLQFLVFRVRVGYILRFDRGAVDWEKCQAKHFRYFSSAEAEYIAAFELLRKPVWFKDIHLWLVLFPQLKIPLYVNVIILEQSL
ncbi:zinc finger, CCHC-type containing protein [Tanacetum coccineum]